MKSSTTNVETSNVEIPLHEEVFHESSESFQEEYSSSSLNDDVQQSPEEVILPQTNTQSISINMIPNADEVSTSHNVFNERLEDAYFDAKSSIRTRGQLANSCLFSCLLSFIEPANVAEALKDADWFGYSKQSKVVAVGYSQQEGIDYDETFVLVARIEVIRLFLAYAAHKDFTVFQMDVKTTFLNGILKEEVYVGQPLGFVSKQYPDHVYALDKALYGLKQAPQTWYDVLSQFIESVPTPMVEQAKLKLDLVGKPVDHTDYQSMIGSLMYVTSGRPDIMFATCDKLVCWSSKKQNYVSISIVESEYVTVSSCSVIAV
uniref:Reverse transcriptase Ty1/copia-type domain-containing protein n=1 Tax=Tanacetum cinerariifolium TaxID=118510 RepID=A0A6L2KNW8_TANCI|nr:hypothetical protein [Tanacetum cinerariifolium]